MKGQTTIHTVNGIKFEVYSDFRMRGTFATNTQTEETRQISWSGYITKDFTVRKAIAIAFRLPTFRK